jgi:hypothetical protein
MAQIKSSEGFPTKIFVSSPVGISSDIFCERMKKNEKMKKRRNIF